VNRRRPAWAPGRAGQLTGSSRAGSGFQLGWRCVARLLVMFAAVLAMVVSLSAGSPVQAAVTTRVVSPRWAVPVVGHPHRVCASNAAASGGTVHPKIAGIGGVPSSGVSAAVLNVTVTAPIRNWSPWETRASFLRGLSHGHGQSGGAAHPEKKNDLNSARRIALSAARRQLP
jgi:hypothetical protein